MRDRARVLSVLNVRYRKIGVPGVCYYCGMPGDSLDHVPPLSLADERTELEDLSTPHWLVHSCRECNGALGNSPLLLLTARRAALVRHYRSKYRNLLNTPEWTKEEIAELGKNMKSKVKAALRMKAAVETMLAVLETAYPEPRWEPRQNTWSDDMPETHTEAREHP